jgi:hypothetical protein
MTKKQDEKIANKALNIAIASIFGAIIPIIGLLLGIISLTISANIKDKDHVKTAKLIASIGIAISVLAGIGYGMIAYNNYEANLKQQKIEDNTRLQNSLEQRRLELEKENKKAQFDQCIANVENWYKSNATGYRSYEYWQLLIQRKQQLLNECQIKYPI